MEVVDGNDADGCVSVCSVVNDSTIRGNWSQMSCVNLHARS